MTVREDGSGEDLWGIVSRCKGTLSTSHVWSERESSVPECGGSGEEGPCRG